MMAQEENLISSLVAEINAISERQDSYERSCELRLKRLENAVDLLGIAIDRFHELLAIFDFENRDQNEERRPYATLERNEKHETHESKPNEQTKTHTKRKENTT